MPEFWWEDADGVVRGVVVVRDDLTAKMFNEPGHEYVSIRVVDEARLHTAIVRLETLVAI
jgi:D-lyxose ketol-isomerase